MSAGDFFCRLPISLIKAITAQRLTLHARAMLDELLSRLLSLYSENVARYGTRYSTRAMARVLKIWPTQAHRALRELLGRGMLELRDGRLWVIHPSKWFCNDHEPANKLPWAEHLQMRMLVFQPGLVPHRTRGWSYPQKGGSPQAMPELSTDCVQAPEGATVGRSPGRTPFSSKRGPSPRAGKRELPEGSGMSEILKSRIMLFYLWHKGKKTALVDIVPRILDAEYPDWRLPGHDITRPDVAAAVQARLESICEGKWTQTSTEIQLVLRYVAENHEKLAAHEKARARMEAFQAEEMLYARAGHAFETLLTLRALNGLSEEAGQAVQRWDAGLRAEPEVIIALAAAEQRYGRDGTTRDAETTRREQAAHITPRSTEPPRDLPALLSPERRETIIFCGTRRLAMKGVFSTKYRDAIIRRGTERLVNLGVLPPDAMEPPAGQKPPRIRKRRSKKAEPEAQTPEAQTPEAQTPEAQTPEQTPEQAPQQTAPPAEATDEETDEEKVRRQSRRPRTWPRAAFRTAPTRPAPLPSPVNGTTPVFRLIPPVNPVDTPSQSGVDTPLPELIPPSQRWRIDTPCQCADPPEALIPPVWN